MAKKSKQTQAWQSWKSRECLAGAKAEQAGDRWTKNPSVPFFRQKEETCLLFPKSLLYWVKRIYYRLFSGAVQFLHGLEKEYE